MTDDQPSVLRDDLNDVSAWYELEFDSIDDYLFELKARASEMSHDTHKELLVEIPKGDDVYFWVTTLAKAATDPGDKFRRMQEAFYNMGSWPGWDSADRNSEFLEILWAINDVAKALPADPDVISKVLAFVLEDPEIWMFPLAPTAIVEAQQVREVDVRLILGPNCLAACRKPSNGSAVRRLPRQRYYHFMCCVRRPAQRSAHSPATRSTAAWSCAA